MAIYDQGDIIEVSFDPSIGHEPQKKRPAVVVSTYDFNMRSSLTFVAPITSTFNKYPLHVPQPFHYYFQDLELTLYKE